MEDDGRLVSGFQKHSMALAMNKLVVDIILVFIAASIAP